jgi:protein TonB
MSAADGTPTASPMLDPDLRASRDPGSRLSRLGRAAVIAALLFHAGLVGAIFFPWQKLFPGPPPPPPPIAVTLVKEPPAPKPAPAPKPPAPTPPANHELLSGADNQTTAPAAAAEKAPEAAPPPAPLPPQDLQTKTAIPVPPPTPAPTKDIRPPKPKLAERETAPTSNRRLFNRAPSDTEHEGDPYLNHLKAQVEEHRYYPPNAVGSLGLPLEGTAVYAIFIGPNGALLGVEIEKSAGAVVLDNAGLKMIRDAAPFPPPPSYMSQPVVITAPIEISPAGG